MTLTELKNNWQDTPEYHKHIHELFTQLVNEDDMLNEHRTFIENNIFGMGERSFQWFWKLMVDEMPDGFGFLEIGVHKAQVVSLIRLLANRLDKSANIYGITPMNGADTGWTEDDYEGDIKRIHDKFGLRQPELFKGYSQDEAAIVWAAKNGMVDIGYVDGSHKYDDCLYDLRAYGGLVKTGGYLVIDDAACSTHQNFGVFQGIAEVCEALEDYMQEQGDKWEWCFNIVHIMVYRRK